MSFGIPVRNGLGVGLLASTTLSTRNRAPFSPASLFATGEQGAWYDPSDLTTLFQDSLGITPVTAAAQQVGLALDKSQGLVLGPELVTNGTFESGVTGWTKGTGTINPLSWDSVGKRMVITNDLAYFASATQVISGLTVGRSYLITGVVSSNTVQAKLNIISGSESNFVPAGGGIARLIFTATSTSHTLAATNQQNTLNGVAYWDDISFKLLPGNHAFQSNSAQRPTLGRNPFTGTRNRLTFTEQFDNAAWVKNADTVTANATVAPDGTSTADKLIPNTSITQHFVTSADLTPGTCARSIYMKAGEYTFGGIGAFYSTPSTYAFGIFNLANGTVTATSIGDTATITSVGDGWYRCTLVTSKVGATSFGGFQARAYASDPGTSFSVSFAGNGTSGIFIWGAQLETGSTATAYQRVVSSFDVTEAGVPDVWYLSFDGTDDGMLTGTITPGTNKAQAFSGVRRLLFGTSQCIVEHSASADANNGSTAIFASPGGGTARIAFYSRGTALSAAPTTGASDVPITQVATGIGDIAADTAILRLNGTQIATSATDQGTGNYLAYPLYLGRRGGATLPFNGRIYSMIVRFGANLSAAQIAQTETWVGGKTGVTI
jgi:hypothetical protein